MGEKIDPRGEDGIRKGGMAENRSYVARNDAERERLRTLVERLSDEDLSRSLEAGWTVAAVLAHLAFWDGRILALLERWRADGSGPVPAQEDPADVDWINDAAKGLCLALAPREAAKLALRTAEAVDRQVAEMSAELIARNAELGSPINLVRAEHRREHLDQIERAFAG